MKNILLVSVIFILAGCENEIDRCVLDQVSAWKDRQIENKKVLDEKSQLGNGSIKFSDAIELMPIELESEVRAKARLECLKAASKS